MHYSWLSPVAARMMLPVGFNISKVVPLKFPVELEGIDDPKLPILGLVKPCTLYVDETFQLTDHHSEAGDALDSVIMQGTSI